MSFILLARCPAPYSTAQRLLQSVTVPVRWASRRSSDSMRIVATACSTDLFVEVGRLRPWRGVLLRVLPPSHNTWTRNLTFDIPEELVERIRLFEDQLPRILELGVRELHTTARSGFQGIAEVLETLAGLPTPEEILALRPSEALQTRMSDLLEKNRTEGLSTAETQEWEHYQYLEHIVRMAKAKAALKLQAS